MASAAAGKSSITEARPSRATLSLTNTFSRASQGAEEQGQELAHGVAPFGVGGGRRVGDELGVRDEERLDDPQARRVQRPAGLGDLDDAVSDIRHLRLGGAVGERNVGIDALATSDRRVSSGTRRDAQGARCSARSARVRYGDASATASTTRMGFEVAFEYSSWPERHHVRPALFDPVAPVMPMSNSPSAT